MVCTTLAAPSRTPRRRGRCLDAIAMGRLMPKADGERGEAYQHMVAEIVGQPRPCVGEAGVEDH